MLEDLTDRPSRLAQFALGEVGNHAVTNGNGATRWLLEQGEATHERGLSSTTLPNDCEDLASLNLKVHLVKRAHLIRRVAEYLGEVLYLNH